LRTCPPCTWVAYNSARSNRSVSTVILFVGQFNSAFMVSLPSEDFQNSKMFMRCLYISIDPRQIRMRLFRSPDLWRTALKSLCRSTTKVTSNHGKSITRSSAARSDLYESCVSSRMPPRVRCDRFG
jgi:hypothetical protein